MVLVLVGLMSLVVVMLLSSMLSGFGSAEERMKRYNNIYKQHLADEDSVECKSKLD